MRSLISVIHVLGSVLALFAVLFLLPIGTALYYHEAAISAFLSSALLSLRWLADDGMVVFLNGLPILGTNVAGPWTPVAALETADRRVRRRRCDTG